MSTPNCGQCVAGYGGPSITNSVISRPLVLNCAIFSRQTE